MFKQFNLNNKCHVSIFNEFACPYLLGSITKRCDGFIRFLT